MKSIAYWHPILFQFFNKYIWKRDDATLTETYKAILPWIYKNSSVCELAAGIGDFYTKCLKGNVSDYSATDINPSFVRYMCKKGINASLLDMRKAQFNTTDIFVILQALYNFKDQAGSIISEIAQATNEHIIIVEPVDNILNSNRTKDKIKAHVVDIGEGPIFSRFRSDELIKLCDGISQIIHSQFLPQNQLLIVLKGQNFKNSSCNISEQDTKSLHI